MRRLATLAAVLFAATSARAQGPDTEVWTGTLSITNGAWTIGPLANASRAPGYDNHPWWDADGRSLWFVSGRDGKQYDIYHVGPDLGTPVRRSHEPENEYSPKPAANGFFTVLREEAGLGTRLWRYRPDGTPDTLVARADHLGYYAFVDARTVALYVNEPARGFLIEDLRTHRIDRVGERIRAQPVPVPGARAVTVIHDDSSGTPWLERYDIDARKFTRLVRSLPNVGWHSAGPAGTVLEASGNTIYAFDPKRDTAWRAVARFDHPELQALARVSLNAAGDRIAVVSQPADSTAIRNARALSNRAIVARDSAAFAASIRPEFTVTTSVGTHSDGRDAYVARLAASYRDDPSLVYVRTPDRVTVNPDRKRASEEGTWVGTSTLGGASRFGGPYLAHWVRTEAGWQLLSELFVGVHCTGPICAKR
ncbi:MAG: DUF4440 domain-containing protein [Gemmatimonadetes bacterium]|nr:DUF4440 domain-containing protein [Gemmatimonadota bacterium]